MENQQPADLTIASKEVKSQRNTMTKKKFGSIKEMKRISNER